MTKLVVINLGEGSLSKGFPKVTAQLWETNNPRPTQFSGGLPPAPKIYELYKRFQLIYGALYQSLRTRNLTGLKPELKSESKPELEVDFKVDPEFEIDPEGLTNVSESDFADVCDLLRKKINVWLNSTLFRPIDKKLRSRLSIYEDFQIVIETSDRIIQRLPWHLWDFLEDYQKAEVSLSTLKYEQVKKNSQNKVNKVRILAILGNSEGINLQEDRILLEQLPDVSMMFLVEPSRRELDKWLWDKQGWDILFFAGHSQTDDRTGKIHINKTNSLSIAELKNALKYAIGRGLKLAIFNSCDGLGLAKELADLHIPQIIVMRENVPDIIAHEFLKNFLTAFAGGESLHLAVRYARSKLQGLEDNFPGASWLPVICQNPAEVTPTWEELRDRNNSNFSRWSNRQSLQTALIASVIITSFLAGMRSLGLMQQWELSAFDSMMRNRPAEPADKRLLIIRVTEADIQAHSERRKSSLSDAALEKLLRKLQPHQPRAIGLDIYRDFPTETPYSDLATRLQQSDNFIAICKVSDPIEESPGILPPPEIPITRTGFSDVVEDGDFIVRRHLLSLTPGLESDCKAQYSLSIQLAGKYLEKEGIGLQFTEEGYLQLGSVVFTPLEVPTGGYQKFDHRGHQVLLNYRSSAKIAREITLTQALEGEFEPNWVKDRIVLIGVEAESVKDSFLTPYQELSGVMIHAHMVSQILSAVLDRRPLLWVWTVWGEVLWIWGWSFLGAIIALYRESPLKLSVFIGTALLSQYIVCFILLLQGGWIPLVPSVLSLSITYFGVKTYTGVLNKNTLLP